MTRIPVTVAALVLLAWALRRSRGARADMPAVPEPLTNEPDETEDGLYVPMAAYLPQSLTLTVDTSTGGVTSTVRELWRN